MSNWVTKKIKVCFVVSVALANIMVANFAYGQVNGISSQNACPPQTTQGISLQNASVSISSSGGLGLKASAFIPGARYDGLGTPVSASWSFEPNQADENRNPSKDGCGLSKSYTYPKYGTYIIETALYYNNNSCNPSTLSCYIYTTVTVGAPPPTVTFSASPTSISLGASSTLTWSSTNATSCAGTGGWNQPSLGPSGSASVQPTAATTYSISCTGPGGKSAVSSVTVSIAPPTVTLSANPTSISPGASSTLTWSSANATSCTGTGGWNQNLAISGSMAVTPASTKTYSISCTGPGDTSPVKSATVSVIPVQNWLVPILNFLLGG